MPDSSNRYSDCKNLIYKSDEGQEIVYKERRFIPKIQTFNLGQIIIQPYDRLDNVSARIIGDPLQYWRICDSNIILHPLEITGKSKIINIGINNK